MGLPGCILHTMFKYSIDMGTVITECKERIFPDNYITDRNRYWDSYTKTFRIVGRRMENFETYSLDTLALLGGKTTVSHAHLSKILFSDVIFTRFCSAKNVVDSYGESALIHPCVINILPYNPKSGEYFLGKEKKHSILEDEHQYTLISTPFAYREALNLAGLTTTLKEVLTKELDMDLALSVDTLISYNNNFHFISTVSIDMSSKDLNKINKHSGFESFEGRKMPFSDDVKATSDALEILRLLTI